MFTLHLTYSCTLTVSGHLTACTIHPRHKDNPGAGHHPSQIMYCDHVLPSVVETAVMERAKVEAAVRVVAVRVVVETATAKRAESEVTMNAN